MITFSVSRLEKETIGLAGTEPGEFLELGENELFHAAAPVEYDLEVERAAGGALVRGRCGTVISGLCGRCLAPVEQPIEADKIALFVEIPAGVEVCDISEDIREELLLELPMNLLCDPDCKGLCPKCGADLNQGDCGCRRSPGGSDVWGALDGIKLSGK